MSSRYKGVTFRIPVETLIAMDSHIDGFKYRNRTHLVSVVLDQWVRKHSIAEVRRLQVELPHTIEPTPVSKQPKNEKLPAKTIKKNVSKKKTSSKKQAAKK